MDSVADDYVTILGPVKAVRVTEKNVHLVSEWCNGEVKTQVSGDGPTEKYIMLKTFDRHGKIVNDYAYPGEWVVVMEYDGGHFAVYEDKLFLRLVTNTALVCQASDDKCDEVIKIMRQLMEYQDFVTQKGGSLDETAAAAELAALQVVHLLR